MRNPGKVEVKGPGEGERTYISSSAQTPRFPNLPSPNKHSPDHELRHRPHYARHAEDARNAEDLQDREGAEVNPAARHQGNEDELEQHQRNDERVEDL